MLHIRYFVCKNFEIASEICALDFSRFPEEKILFVENDIHRFQKYIFSLCNNTQREPDQFFKTYRDSDSYQKIYSDAIKTKKGDPSFPYFEFTRNPSPEDN